eukprot:1105423-Prymnesium_polylepis.1
MLCPRTNGSACPAPLPARAALPAALLPAVEDETSERRGLRRRRKQGRNVVRSEHVAVLVVKAQPAARRQPHIRRGLDVARVVPAAGAPCAPGGEWGWAHCADGAHCRLAAATARTRVRDDGIQLVARAGVPAVGRRPQREA